MRPVPFLFGLAVATTALIATPEIGIAQDPSAATPAAAPAPASGASDWPCEQAERPEISTGSVWSGPDPTAAEETWRNDASVVALIEQVAPRRMPQDDAVAAIHRFSAGYTTDRPAILTQVFAGLFYTLNKERGEIIRGIRHFNRRQDSLSKRIEDGWKTIDELDPNSTDPSVLEQRAALQQAIDWDSRIFDDRQKLLPEICQQPIVIEQRLFALSRAIQDDLKAAGTP